MTRVEAKMRLAQKLADRYSGKREIIPFNELRTKAVPDWVGQELDVTDDWLRALQTEPKLNGCGQSEAGHGMMAKLRRASTPTFADAVLTKAGGLVQPRNFMRANLRIQDIASASRGLLAIRNPVRRGGTPVPRGGKLLHLSDLMQNKG